MNEANGVNEVHEMNEMNEERADTVGTAGNVATSCADQKGRPAESRRYHEALDYAK